MTETTPTQRAAIWLQSRDTGISSQAVVSKMLGGQVDAFSCPHDPSDLGRCLRLLAIIPEWRPRILEMGSIGHVWAALVLRWDELEATMADEVGIDWAKAKRATKTYDLMQKIIRPAEEKQRAAYRSSQRAKEETNVP